MMRTRTAAFVGALALCVAWAARADINDGIISVWTFDDGTGTDAAGVSDGELIDGAKIVDGGKFGKALDVDGAAAYMSVPHANEYDDMADGFSVSAWAFVRQGRDHSAIAWKGTGIGWGAFYTFRIATTSNTGMTWGTCPIGVEGWFATAGAIQAGEWLHLCLTADGSEAIAYVNNEIPISNEGNPKGVAGPYQTFSGEPIEMGVGRNVGGADNGVHNFLDGMIDEVYIWDRALTPDEVADLSGGARPEAFLAVSSKGKATTTWGALKSR